MCNKNEAIKRPYYEHHSGEKSAKSFVDWSSNVSPSKTKTIPLAINEAVVVSTAVLYSCRAVA